MTPPCGIRSREALYWSGREVARLQMTACVFFMVISVQIIAGTAFLVPATPFVLAYLVYLSLPEVLGEQRKILIFSLFISCISIAVSLKFWKMARLDLALEATTKFELIFIAQMKEGQIPCPIIMMLLLPTMATPVGISAWWAKVSGLCCLVLFAATSATIYQGIKSDEDEGKLEMRFAIFFHDLSSYLCFIGIAVISSLRGSAVSESYIAYLHAGSLADSILNHILKASQDLRECNLLFLFCFISLKKTNSPYDISSVLFLLLSSLNNSTRTRLREQRAFLRC